MFSGGSGGEAELWREDLALGAQGGGRTAGPHTVPENPPHVPGRVRLERPTPERRPGFLSGDVAGFPPAKGSRMLNIREHVTHTAFLDRPVVGRFQDAAPSPVL